MDLNLATFEPVLKALASAGLPMLEGALTTVLADAVLGPAGPLISPKFNGLWASINRAIGLPPEAEPAQTAATITAMPANEARDKLAAVQEQHGYLLTQSKQDGDQDLAAMAQQQAINAEAARSGSFFVAGYRPAIVWGFGALAVAYGGAPLFGWLVAGLGWQLGPPPALDWRVWFGLFALLGVISGLRSWDKLNGTATVGLTPAKRAGR